MRRLVFNGTAFEFRGEVDGAAPVGAKVADAERRSIGHYQRRQIERRERMMKRICDAAPTVVSYRPGPLLEMRRDQCRYCLPSGKFCGSKGYPWCDEHRAVVYRPRHEYGISALERK